MPLISSDIRRILEGEQQLEVQNRLSQIQQDSEIEYNGLHADLARSEAAEAESLPTMQDFNQGVHCLQTQLQGGGQTEAGDTQLMKELESVKKERDRLRWELGISEWNLEQTDDDHRKVGVLEKTVSEQVDTISKLEKEKKLLKNKKNAKAAMLKAIDATLSQKTKENAQLQATLDDTIKEAEKAKANLSNAQDSFEKEKSKRLGLKDRFRRLRDERDRLQREVEELRPKAEKKGFWRR